LPPDLPEETLARSLLSQLRPDFAEREATARQFAELLLDAVDAALPLTHHAPAELALPLLESLGQQVDLFAWEGAPGWDEVLARGLLERAPLVPGALLLDGIGASQERTQQRGELKRRAQAEAARLVVHGRAQSMIAAHASILRLAGLGAVFGPLQLPPSPGELPPENLPALLEEMEVHELLHDEWLARLLAHNPAAASEAQFRTFFAGLSQSLRAARALRDGAHDLEALLGAVVSWQPQRWPRIRGGAAESWITELCALQKADSRRSAPPPRLATPQPPAPRVGAGGAFASTDSLREECQAALALFSRLWFAKDASIAALYTMGALFTARCASAAALCEELANDARAG